MINVLEIVNKMTVSQLLIRSASEGKSKFYGFFLSVLGILFFLPLSLFSQISFEDNSKVFIAKNTIVSQNLIDFQESDAVYIHIELGAEVANLHLTNAITVVHLNEVVEIMPQKANNENLQTVKLNNVVPQPTVSVEKKRVQKIILGESPQGKTFWFSFYQNKVGAITPTLTVKVGTFFNQESNAVVLTNLDCKTAILEKYVFVKNAVYPMIHGIRPPPFKV